MSASASAKLLIGLARAARVATGGDKSCIEKSSLEKKIG
jgi:hypothetical protein